MENITPQDELKNAPLLSKLQGTNPYAVPDNYFESLTQRIQNRISQKPVIVRKISYSRMAARLAAAASVILFLGTAGWFYFHKPDQMQEEIYFTPEQVSNSVYFDDLDLTLLKDEAASSTELTTVDEIESYLLDHDLTFLYE